MTLSEYSITHLGKAICGDVDYMPYQTGPMLVTFFNKYGYNEVYGQEPFPSRWKYTEDKCRELNGTPLIKQAIEDSIDPRRFLKLPITVENAVAELNEILNFDKLAITKVNEYYKLISIGGLIVEPSTAVAIGHDFVSEQIEKCKTKLTQEDYNGAITNARSLLEAIFIDIIERYQSIPFKSDGDLDNLWRATKKVMNLQLNKDTMPDFVIQILSGIDTSLKGLAALSNKAGDRHATKFKARKHHAKLAVNLAMTIADFILESWDFLNEAKTVKGEKAS
ncbi:abortive infection family protein [Pedobacter agri]|uniref:Abortive infection family protein n=1 Tax=Pedobacter agri TaxID=454586 RepID=A0A9X3IBC8_9SPHI|nr:abortive infection family protein [Pedobacter agri]MCX3266458.1 abortive infection family protein [Pedobacter agri]